MATPFIRFPGGAGDYVYTLDSNIIDADSAHCYQSSGAWAVNGNILPASFQSVVAPWASFGGRAVRGEAQFGTLAASMRIGTAPGSTVPVSPSTVYSATTEFYCQTTSAATEWNIFFRFYDAGGATVQTTQTPVPFISGQVQTVTFTETSPSNAASATFIVRLDPIVDAGDLLYAGSNCIRAGTDTGFVPSLDIVGSSFITEEADPTPVLTNYVAGDQYQVGPSYAGDVRQWALHDGPDAVAPIVAQVTASDALRALPL